MVRILIGHQTHADFGKSLGRQNGLGTFADVATPDAVDIQRRANGSALQGGITSFAVYGSDAQVIHVVLFVERRFIHGLALFGTDNQHIIVKARNGDVVVFILHGSNHLAEDVDRVGYCAAVYPGMQVAVGRGHFYFHVAQAPQAHGNRRRLVVDDGGV